MSFISRLGELRLKDVPRLFELGELGKAVQTAGSSYVKNHFYGTGTGRPIIHAAIVL